MKQLLILAALALVAKDQLGAVPTNSIIQTNSDAVVYLEVTNSDGGVVDHGTGFVVSHDGFIVTAAHLKVGPTQTMWAVLGARQGVRYSLDYRDADPSADTALWQLPQNSSCRTSTVISDKTVHSLDPVMALGFPGADQGLSPAKVNITNTSSAVGFIKVDGLLQPGNSGGPVFDEDGHVIGLVQGGTMPGTDNNDVVPIAAAVALLRKHGVQFGLGTEIPFAHECYATCRNPANGVESWGEQKPWSSNTGWEGGGHDETGECNALMAADLANDPTAQIVLLPGKQGRWEQSKKDWGRAEYKYFCAGTILSKPVYKNERSEICGLR